MLYGEWLRREGRRVDARGQLRAALDQFTSIGMEAFAERARRELIAAGGKVCKRSAETRGELTPQEEQTARLARAGRTSPEIGAQLFLSTRTVQWHLGKVFTKLGIGSRRDLRAALAGRDSRTSQPSRKSQRPVACPAGSFARSCPGATANVTAAGGTPAGRVRSLGRPRGP